MSLQKITDKLITLIAVGMCVFQLYTAFYMPFPGMQQRSIHLACGLALAFLAYPKKRPENPSLRNVSYLFGIALAVLTFITCLNVTFNWLEMNEPMRLIQPTQSDKVLGFLLILLVLLGTVRVVGWAMPIIGLVFLGYAYFGSKIPFALLRHAGVKLSKLISMGYMTTEGIFSSVLGVSTTQVFIFLMFGQLLESLGGSDFFLDWANSGFGKFRGGPAKVAIFGSALFGSISGSAVANVVGTGTITIPLMKRVGYKGDFAGAVESVASTGGLIMPPVMGAAAFIMADTLGVSYWEVCKAAVIPAVMYYLALYTSVDLKAKQSNLKGLPAAEVPDGMALLKSQGWMYIPPLVILVFFLGVLRYPAYKACLYCCILLVVLASFKREKRGVLKREWLNILVKTAKSSVTVVMACSCAGVILLGLQSSGLILKLSNILISLANNNLGILLFLVMLGSLIMGMGLPASACYAILCILAAPAIVKLGVPPLAAHLFVLYFGSMSAITPPVAMAAFAAAPIAGESAVKIGITAFKMAMPSFLIAFCLAIQPELVMIGSAVNIVLVVVICLAGVLSMSVGLQGYLFQNESIIRRIAWVAGGVLLILPQKPLTIMGIVIALALVITEKNFWKYVKVKRRT